MSLDLLGAQTLVAEQLQKLTDFHHFVFSSVLHLEKDPMVFCPDSADIGMLIVPLNKPPGDKGRHHLPYTHFYKYTGGMSMYKRLSVCICA